MKKILLAVSAFFLVSAVFAQDAVKVRDMSTVAKVKTQITGREEAVPQQVNPMVRSNSRNFIGATFYDLQTNGSMANRVVAHSDGTISTVWTTCGATAASRGTGYNYYSGGSWINESSSTARIEPSRTGWATITCVGNAEITAAHNGSTALVIGIRPQKGTGDWTFSTLEGPEVANGSSTSTCLLWPSLASSGNIVHLIACTESDAGYLYQGIQTCLVYYRGTFNPTNNTIAWEQPRVVGNVTPAEQKQFSGDAYAIAAKNNTVAIVSAPTFSDVFLWKSTDNGVNFTKSTVFQHPYAAFDEATTLVVDSPYVSDGSCAVAIGDDGIAHVAFGITRMLNDEVGDGSWSYFPGVTGMLYWNENQQPILNSTATTLEPDNIEAAGYTVIRRSDLNGDGAAYFGNDYDLPSYGVGTVSIPQIIASNNNVYLIYNALLDWPFVDFNSDMHYRGIFATKSTDNGANFGDVSWLSYNKDNYYINSWEWLEDSTATLDDLIAATWTDGENVFPAVAPNIVNGKIAMTWQWDFYAGSEIKQSSVAVSQNDNSIYFELIDASDIGVYNNTDEIWQGLWIDSTGINNHNISGMKMYPNPASESVNVTFSADNAENGVLSVMNLMGQTVYTMRVDVNEGYNFVTVPVNQLTAGVYMVNIRTNKGISTQKLIVK